jgi:hypothetical protein
MDVMEKFVDGLGTNYIESARELKEIFGPLQLAVDETPWLGKKAKKVTKNLNGLAMILRFLSNAALSYQFGVAPTMSDAKACAKAIDVWLLKHTQPGGLFHPGTYYGSASLSPDQLNGLFYDGYEVDSITFRSKARIGLSLDGLAPYVLGAQWLGVLPSFSNFWDLIPYSWLLDYVGPIGDLTSLVDYQILVAALNVEYSVNSITVDRNIIRPGDNVTFEEVPGFEAIYRSHSRLVIPGGLPPLFPTSIPLLTTDFTNIFSKWKTVGPFAVLRII